MVMADEYVLRAKDREGAGWWQTIEEAAEPLTSNLAEARRYPTRQEAINAARRAAEPLLVRQLGAEQRRVSRGTTAAQEYHLTVTYPARLDPYLEDYLDTVTGPAVVQSWERSTADDEGLRRLAYAYADRTEALRAAEALRTGAGKSLLSLDLDGEPLDLSGAELARRFPTT